MSWDEMLASFREYQVAAHLSPRTIRAREEMLLILARTTGKAPSEITYKDLLAFIGRPHAYTGQPRSAGSMQVESSYLKIWGRWAAEEGITEKDPAQRMPRVRAPRRTSRPLDMRHIFALLQQERTWQSTLDIVAIAANTGLRVGEVAGIHGHDFDGLTRVLKCVRKGGFVHYLHCTDAVVEIAERLSSDGWWFPSPYKSELFPEGGGHITPKSASACVNRAIRRAGITDKKLTAHSIRHFYCALLIGQGTPLQVVSELMGHASIATTQFYFKTDDRDAKAVVQALPEISQSSAWGELAA